MECGWVWLEYELLTTTVLTYLTDILPSHFSREDLRIGSLPLNTVMRVRGVLPQERPIYLGTTVEHCANLIDYDNVGTT